MPDDDEIIKPTPRIDFARAELPEVNPDQDPDLKEEDDVADVPAAAAIAEPTVEELVAKRDELEASIQKKKEDYQIVVMNEIRKVMWEHEITLEKLVQHFGGIKLRRKSHKARVRYRDPVTGTTWSGRGKEPLWIRGKNRDDFAV